MNHKFHEKNITPFSTPFQFSLVKVSKEQFLLEKLNPLVYIFLIPHLFFSWGRFPFEFWNALLIEECPLNQGMPFYFRKAVLFCQPLINDGLPKSTEIDPNRDPDIPIFLKLIFFNQ